MAGETVQPELLMALQRGLPLVRRPFAVLAERVGSDEDGVLAYVRRLLEEGTARRFGGVFDSRSLGYESTLCAVSVLGAELDGVAARLTPNPGVTHCYERDGQPNLWFTLTARQDRFDGERAELAAALRPYDLMDLPARQTFKIEAVFDARLMGRTNEPAPPGRDRPHLTAQALDGSERAVVRRLQDSIPCVPEPFTALGRELGWEPDDLLDLLERWEQGGLLRRIGLIVRHRELGFAANGMCVWAAEPERVAGAGRVLAGFPEVTHCYERRLHRLFPFNLFAMIHGASRDDLQRVRARMGAAAGLTGGHLLMTSREFKKTSPRFFEET